MVRVNFSTKAHVGIKYVASWFIQTKVAPFSRPTPVRVSEEQP